MKRYAVGVASRNVEGCLQVLWDVLAAAGHPRDPHGDCRVQVLHWDDAVWILGADDAILDAAYGWAPALGQVIRVHMVTAKADNVVEVRLLLVHADGRQTVLARDDDPQDQPPEDHELAARLAVALEFHESLHDDATAVMVHLRA